MSNDYKFTVLMVDDEVEILESYKKPLEEFGDFNIASFTQTSKAIEFLNDQQSNVIFILSDFNMPEQDGLEFKQELNNLGIDIPFAILTAYYNKEMAVKGMELGVQKFLEKPITPEDLLVHINAMASERKTQLVEEREMQADFLEESVNIMDEIEALILELEDNPSESTLNNYFRLLHTLKGTAACVGLKNISNFSHHYESFINKIRNGEIEVSSGVISILLKGFDEVKRLFNMAQEGEEFLAKLPDLESFFKVSESGEASDSLDEKNEKAASAEKSGSNSGRKEGIWVDLESLDEFMESSGELTVLRSFVDKIVSTIETRYKGDKDIETLQEYFSEMHKVSGSLQRQITELRKVSVQSITRPFKRIVRDVAKNGGKEVDFKIIGEHLRVDTNLGRVLGNCLVHMIRNSVDHGIETVEKRKAAGKNPEGKVHLTISVDNDFIHTTIEDDGAGIDKDIIRNKALEKNIHTEAELNEMDENEIFQIIFAPGFSTAAEITDISGRGVGMDMVKSSIIDNKGTIHIASEKGVGTTFKFKIPLPRVVQIMDALLVRACGQSYAIDQNVIKEVIQVEHQTSTRKAERLKDGYVLRYFEELIPMVWVESLSHDNFEKTLAEKLGVIVSFDNYKLCLVIDEIIDSEEIVIREISSQLQNKGIFPGASLIGDGGIALILNHEEFVNHFEITPLESLMGAEGDEGNDLRDDESLLLFKLRDGKLYGIPMFNLYRVEEVDPQSIEFTGGQELLHYRGSPMAILDIEKNLGLDEVILQEESAKQNLLVFKRGDAFYALRIESIYDIGSPESPIDSSNVDRQGFLGTVYIQDRLVTILSVDYLLDEFGLWLSRENLNLSA